jgi:hypothetical protein
MSSDAARLTSHHYRLFSEAGVSCTISGSALSR